MRLPSQLPRPKRSCPCSSTAWRVSVLSINSPPPAICPWTSNLSWSALLSAIMQRAQPPSSHVAQVRAVWRAWLHYASFSPSQVRTRLYLHPRMLLRVGVLFRVTPQCQPLCSFQSLLATSWFAGASSDAVVEVAARCSTFYLFPPHSISSNILFLFALQVILSALNESRHEECLSRMLVLLAASFRGQQQPVIPQLSVESATRLSSTLHALSTPGGPLVHLPSQLLQVLHDLPLYPPTVFSMNFHHIPPPPLFTHQHANLTFTQYPTSNVRGLARALDDALNPDGSWARRTVYHSFRLLHPYQWSHRCSCDLSCAVIPCQCLLDLIISCRSLGRWAYSSASSAALRVIGFIARTLRIQAPASTTESPGSERA